MTKKKPKYLLLSFVLYFGCYYCYCCCCVCVFFFRLFYSNIEFFSVVLSFLLLSFYTVRLYCTQIANTTKYTPHTRSMTQFLICLLFCLQICPVCTVFCDEICFFTLKLFRLLLLINAKKVFIFLRNFCNVVVVAFPSNWSEFHLKFTWLYLCDFFSFNLFNISRLLKITMFLSIEIQVFSVKLVVSDEIMAEWSTEFHLSWSTKSQYRILFTCNCLYTRSKIHNLFTMLNVFQWII